MNDFAGTFQDSSPTTIVDGVRYDAATAARDDDVIDWASDCLGEGDDVMAMSSGATEYGGCDYDDINCDVQAMLESIDFSDAFAAEFDPRYTDDNNDTSVQQYDTDAAFDTDYHISIGQPTCEKRDKMDSECSVLENDLFNVNMFQRTSAFKKRGVSSGKGPSHRTAKKKLKGLPKRPLSKYNLFFQRERIKILAEATENHTRISFENLAKIIGKRWHDLSEEDSEKFRILSELDIARYREEMKAHHAKRRNSIQDTTTTTGLPDDDDAKTVSPSSIKRRNSNCSPRSPSSPRRKRKYSESTGSTTGSIDNAHASQPKATSSPSFQSCDGTPSDRRDEANIVESRNQHDTVSSMKYRSADSSKMEAFLHRNDNRHAKASGGNDDSDKVCLKSDHNLPLKLNCGIESAVVPPRFRQGEYHTKEEEECPLHENDMRPPPTTSQNHPIRRHCQDVDYDDGKSNRTHPVFRMPTQVHYPYPRTVPSGKPHPYIYGNTVPPPSFRSLSYHHSYTNHQIRSTYHTVALPQDHNREVMIYDPQHKCDRRYTIQYKCYTMKRSEAYAYLSRNMNNLNDLDRKCSDGGSGGKHYKISMQDLLLQQNYPIPGVEVDLSNHHHHLRRPTYSLTTPARVYHVPGPPIYYPRLPSSPPETSTQFQNQRR